MIFTNEVCAATQLSQTYIHPHNSSLVQPRLTFRHLVNSIHPSKASVLEDHASHAIENARLLSSSGERVSLAQLTKVATNDGAKEIYREGQRRYIAAKYSVRGRDLESTVEEAIDKVNKQVSLPPGYHIDWAGEYESQKRSQRRLFLVLPITILLIFAILYTMFKSGGGRP